MNAGGLRNQRKHIFERTMDSMWQWAVHEIYDPDESCFWSSIKLICAVLWTAGTVYWTYKFLFQRPWGVLAARRRLMKNRQNERNKQFSSIRERRDALDESSRALHQKILNLKFLDLRKALQNDEISAVDVLNAYISKAFEAQEKFNCVTEFLTDADIFAKELDHQFSGKADKPFLFGVPFSVKENFHIAGCDCTTGLTKLLDNPMTAECTMVAHLRTLGAIPFVRTNVPQALISYVCANCIYGVTGNPHDPLRTPGGSSGGEACLLAAGGTPFALGSDLAGSLRIPAVMCNLVTIKPTSGRLVVENTNSGMPGRGRLGLSYGFITKSVEEQIVLLEAMLHPEYFALSPATVPLPLRMADVRDTYKMRVGYFIDDGFLKPVPACARAVEDTVSRLRSAGHDVFPFTVPCPEIAVDLFIRNLFPDAGQYIKDAYADEDVHPFIKQFVFMIKVPLVLRKCVAYLIRPWSRQMATLCTAQVRDLNDLRRTQEKTDEYVKKFTNYWLQLDMDVLICPGFPVPPIPHQYPSKLGVCGFSTGLFNLLDYPCGTIPVDKVTAKDDQLLFSSYPHSIDGKSDKNPVYSLIRKAAADSQGLPLGVQVGALPFREEVCLRAMLEIDRLIRSD